MADEQKPPLVFGISAESLAAVIKSLGAPMVFAVALGAFIWWMFSQSMDVVVKPLVDQHNKFLSATIDYMDAHKISLKRHDELLEKQGQTLERVSATLDAQGKVLVELSKQINRRDISKESP
jgi:hypothetical protein